jgi:hypothetical protein
LDLYNTLLFYVCNFLYLRSIKWDILSLRSLSLIWSYYIFFSDLFSYNCMLFDFYLMFLSLKSIRPLILAKHLPSFPSLLFSLLSAYLFLLLQLCECISLYLILLNSQSTFVSSFIKPLRLFSRIFFWASSSLFKSQANMRLSSYCWLLFNNSWGFSFRRRSLRAVLERWDIIDVARSKWKFSIKYIYKSISHKIINNGFAPHLINIVTKSFLSIRLSNKIY